MPRLQETSRAATSLTASRRNFKKAVDQCHEDLKTSILLRFFSSLCSACSGVNASSNATIYAQQSPSPSPALRPDVIKVRSILIEGQPASWKVEMTRVRGRESLKAIYFLDEAHGWAGGKDALYETLDGGLNWKRVKIEIPKNAKVASIFFTNHSRGWVVLQKKPSDADHLELDDMSNYQEVYSLADAYQRRRAKLADAA